jgi:3-hydroxymyristoyl/3-hydroxydecanoyl-(acyl carrier protein) dehydratase
LLMEYNLKLAHSFITDQATEAEKQYRAIAIKRVKIGNFILPGDSVVTRITLKEQQEDRFILSMNNEVNGKKVCGAEVEFG